MAVDIERINTRLAKFRGISVDRVRRSLRVRTMRMLGRLDPVRDLVALRARNGAGNEARSDIFPSASVDRFVSDLKSDGIAFGLDLPPDLVREIRAFADTTPCYGNMCTKWGFRVADHAEAEKKAGKAFTVAHYYNVLEECPAIAKLAADPVIHAIARRYIGPTAHFFAPHLWWSFKNDVPEKDRNEYAQRFHFDLDDYRFMKFFFYLTDVDEESGPHVYMKGSQRGKKLRELFPMRRFSDSEVYERYPESTKLVVVGKAGTGFVADTFGIHKGTEPRGRDRLLLQFEWQQHDWGFGSDTVPPGDLEQL